MLNDLLYSTSAQKVLGFLLASPGVKFYDREISRLSGVKKSSSNYSLRSLVGAGLVLTEEKGRMLFYYITLKDPLVRQLKITQNHIVLRPLIEDLQKISIEIILYGRAGAGSNDADSGMDLFVVSRDEREVKELIRKSPLSDTVQCLVQSPREYISLKNNNPLFYNEISKGIILY